MTPRRADPHEPGATALLEASHTLMTSLYPPEHCHYLEIDALREPEIRFFVVEKDGKSIGCGALKIDDGFGELKSIFTDPEARGHGAGEVIIDVLEAEALTAGLTLLRLETGDTLDAAHRLYHRKGYRVCGPFGDYLEGPHSIFMEKRLR